MAFSQLNFQQHLQQPPDQSKQFRELYGNIDTQMNYFNAQNLADQANHPPYIPPFNVVGLAPGPSMLEEGGGGLDLLWNYDLEPKRKWPKEQDFLETNNNNTNKGNNSQISSVDFLQARSVSTGLGLSLDNGRLASSDDSAFLGLAGDDIERELRRQDVEMDRYMKAQGDRMKQAVLEKLQANQLQLMSSIEDKVIQKLREKEAEVENINKKNMELESRIVQLASEANAWQHQAKYNENLISTLKLSLEQVYAQPRDSKEGCGDSEVDDTASCCHGRPLDFHLLSKDNNEMKGSMICKVCRVNQASMLLLPCKHLCLCKECENKLSLCPVCQSSKYIGMEVFM
ncbi:hypothetical protein LIER_17702 [Lithospermum erythrorhizon]|uniref:RING-type domain-containing protein n=1 Tax=Lithospermum erythrorhizon TaxID=34254 RepID=A0AAV3QDR1_LITER